MNPTTTTPTTTSPTTTSATVPTTVVRQRRTPGRTTIIAGFAAATLLAVQAVHAFEHVLQFGYWILNPTDRPWMTPWAMWAHHPLAVGGNMALGAELLHLIGNVLFLAGIAAFAVWYRGRGGAVASCRPLRAAFVVQGVHVVEHITLTATAAFVGTSIGISTFLGTVDGPLMTSWRVWFHFGINLAATWYAARAVLDGRTSVSSNNERAPVGR